MQEAAPPNSLGMCKKVIGNVEMSTKLDMNIEQSSSRSSFSIQPIVVDNSSFPNKSWGRLSFFPGYFSIVIWRRIDPGEFCSFPFWIRPLLRAKEQMKPFVLRVHWFFCRCSRSKLSVGRGGAELFGTFSAPASTIELRRSPPSSSVRL